MINGNNDFYQAALANLQGFTKDNALNKNVYPKTTLIEKSITENDTYNATDDSANGYSTVNVDVDNTYTADDEGKVVSNGELVAQTAYPTEITENDTYDTTNYNSITVNVSSGGGGNATFATATEFNYADDYLSLLTNIDIPSGVETIGYGGFQNCSSLISVTIPNSVRTVDESVFSGCSSLETVTFEQNSRLSNMAYCMFFGCSALTSITIPRSVTIIGETVFGSCSSLETVTFEQNSSLDSIGDGTFSGCSALTSITIPSSVTYIWGSSFDGCIALETMTFEPTTPPELGGDLGLPTTCVIRVPQGTLSAYTSAENYPDPSEYTYEEY